jgi:hypothetical protein
LKLKRCRSSTSCVAAESLCLPSHA